MKYKVISFTYKGVTQHVYIVAVPANNTKTGEDGFLACTFKYADGEPSDPQKGDEISQRLYDTEAEAISEGAKIWRIQTKQRIKLLGL